MPNIIPDSQNITDDQPPLSPSPELESYAKEQEEGIKFLKGKYKDLHNSPEAVSSAKRKELRTGEKVPQKPEAQIANYLSRFREILDRKDEGKRQRGIEALRKIMHRQHVIKPENIPQGYWNSQAEIIINQGRKADLQEGGVHEEKYTDTKGNERINYIFPEELRSQNIEVIIADQKSTMDNWLNYLSSHDAEAYPDWAKYWSFRSMLGLSTYDKEKKHFAKRRKDTVAPFPDLNREALAYVVDIITKKAEGKQIDIAEDNTELQKLIQKENFAKLYAHAIESVTPTEQTERGKIAGEWITYKQGSDHIPLVKSLQGHGTGWCTAGESTAKAQLENGDFHVYYSYDQDGKPSIPRIAIRMEKDQITEVRGVAAEQNLDPYVADVANKKLGEFPDGDIYQKKAGDMKRLTELEKKHKARKDLAPEELRFLYELEDQIQGFGYKEDPRVAEIRGGRDIEKDSKIIDVLDELKIRFNTQPEHYRRPKDIDFNKVKSALKVNPALMQKLALMEITGGKPDIIGETEAEYIFGDCSLQSPSWRRNMNWLQSYEMSKRFGCQLMDKDTYRAIQEEGQFDTESWSWLGDDPAKVKESGDALGGRRYGGGVLVDRFLADYRYPAYGWRGLLRVPKI